MPTKQYSQSLLLNNIQYLQNFLISYSYPSFPPVPTPISKQSPTCFLFTISFHFLVLQKWNHTLCTIFLSGFFLLNIIILRLICVVVGINSSLLFIAERYVIKWFYTTIHLSTYLRMPTWVVPIWAITDKAAINLHIEVFGHTFPFLLSKYLRQEWLYHIKTVYLPF